MHDCVGAVREPSMQRTGAGGGGQDYESTRRSATKNKDGKPGSIHHTICAVSDRVFRHLLDTLNWIQTASVTAPRIARMYFDRSSGDIPLKGRTIPSPGGQGSYPSYLKENFAVPRVNEFSRMG